MILKESWFNTPLVAACSVLLVTACISDSNSTDNFTGLKVKVSVGSALGDFCNQAAKNFNATQPKLDNGNAFRVECEAQGSGDTVTKLVNLATQLKNGTLQADAADFPTIISLDGDIYHTQLIYRINQVFPGQNYIPDITDAQLLANTPMVFMAQADVASGLQKIPDPYQALVTAKTHRDIDPASPPITVNYVHTAPTRSNSGLQTIVAQYTSVSGKRPEELTVADVQTFQSQIQQIQSKITRYGVSTNSLAQSMVKNGPFWASVGSVYESSVITANSSLQPGQERYQAVYPKTTFTSNMRAIVATAPWVSADEKAAAEKFITYWRSPDTQKIATVI
jgi:Ca-activated chloride channel homolog